MFTEVFPQKGAVKIQNKDPWHKRYPDASERLKLVVVQRLPYKLTISIQGKLMADGEIN